MKNRIMAAFLISVLLLLYGCGDRETEVIWETQADVQMDAKAGANKDGAEAGGEESGAAAKPQDGADTDSVPEETQPAQICVDICGEVVNPGVYLLNEGARVYEAVEMAGGLTKDADRNLLNQALLLEDGAKIRVYSEAEAETYPEERPVSLQEEPGSLDDGRINLNTADAALLCTLSGIGEARAADIIAYREAHGGFSGIEEIMQVSGIKEATFEKIKDKIVVE